MSEVTVEQLIIAHPKLPRIAALPLPVVTSFRLLKICTFIDAEMRFFTTARDALIRKYGEEMKEGGMAVKPGSKNWPEFVGEMNKLTAEEVAIPFKPIDVKELPSITAEEIGALKFLLTGFEEEADVDAAIKARHEQLAKRRDVSAVH